MTPRILALPLLATALAATIGLAAPTQSAWASMAPDEATGTTSQTADQAPGQLTVTPITVEQYDSSEEYGDGHCSTESGITICDQVRYDDSDLGVARWSAVAAVGHADELFVDETVKTVEGTKLWSTAHVSGLGPWVRITWVEPQHIGDPNGIPIPGEASLQFLTTLTIPGGAAPSAYCAGPEKDFEYQLTCGSWIPSSW